MQPQPINPRDWQSELDMPIFVEAQELEIPAAEPPLAVSAFMKSRRPKTFSYYFNGQEEILKPRKSPENPQANPQPKLPKQNKKHPKQHTRIKPPKDVIKLGDRLFYLLQPPLESLLGGNTLEFPFEPFPYQFSGISFLFPRHHAVLADEMGLGKTMQCITTIRMLIRSGRLNRVLLVCPKPLVTNWQREFETWAPEIPVIAVNGSQANRAWLWQRDQTSVKIANYELLTRDEHLLIDNGLSFDLVVLDEAQRIKNSGNSTSKVVKKISRERSWALTGTPIENSIEDLVGIFDFVSPGVVSSHMTTRHIRDQVQDFILRRTKDKVMTDMPPKLMRDAELDLSPEQWDSYTSAEKDGVLRLNDMGDEITIKHVFELVLRLKQICNFDPSTGASSKMERLEADMEEVAASGQKAIVFSQWVDAIVDIDEKLQRFNPLQYHGRIPSKKRDGILQEFKENPDRSVLLMSYGAGSVGLNLQFAVTFFYSTGGGIPQSKTRPSTEPTESELPAV